MSRARIRGLSLAWRFAGLLVGTLFIVLPTGAAQGLSQISLIHTATSGDEGNIVLDWTYLDHPLLNGNPEAVILVTHNISGGNVVYNENESKNNMPDEAGFNVLSAPFFADGFESDDVSWWSSTVP